MDPGLEYFRSALARVESRHGVLPDIVLSKAPMTSMEAPNPEREPTDSQTEDAALREFADRTAEDMGADMQRRKRRRRLRTAVLLFLLTFLSTTVVGAGYLPWEVLPAMFTAPFLRSLAHGCTYSVPLMMILFCHEMGHYLQAVRYRVPVSFPFFIPVPLPPLGTMGAIILQERPKRKKTGKAPDDATVSDQSVEAQNEPEPEQKLSHERQPPPLTAEAPKRRRADRRMLFDIAVSGPIAGLLVTLPVLYYGLMTSTFVYRPPVFIFGEPLLVQWMIEFIHGPTPPGAYFAWNGFARAGWVGVFVTAMNLLPIGQLDGGHILYTLIGRAAHWVAWGLILVAVAGMLTTGMYSYILLLLLLMLTGPSHPKTADDTVSLGGVRKFVGWVTLAFLIVGFTFQPLAVPRRVRPVPQNVLPPMQPHEIDALEF